MVLGLLLGVASNVKAELDPSVTIKIYATVCPAIEAGAAVWTPYVLAVQDFWEGTNESSTIGPVSFHAITAGKWQYMCVNNSSNSFSMWLGQETPDGTNKGGGISFPFEIESTNTPTPLSDVKITVSKLDGTNLLSSSVYTFASYFPEVKGIQTNGTVLTSGSATAPSQKIRGVGVRSSYVATNQLGINVISNYISSISNFVDSCLVEVFRDETLVARAQLDIPFTPVVATPTLINSSTLRVNGFTNRQYRLESTVSLLPSDWQSLGLPVFPGNVAVTSNSVSRFFRAFQGP